MQVKCMIKNDNVSIKIQSFIKSKELQVSINSPTQEQLRYDNYVRGFVSKKKSYYCNWPLSKN
jgi:hypothetical protein